MNKLIFFYTYKTVNNTENIVDIEEFKENIYESDIKNKKCVYMCEFVTVLLEELLEYNELFVNCKNGSDGIKNSLIHDFIMKKASYIKKEDDDFLDTVMKRKFEEMGTGPVDYLEEELELEQKEIDEDMRLHEFDDYVLGEGYKKLTEKLGHEPNEDELTSYRQELIMQREEGEFEDDSFIPFLEVQMDKESNERMDSGADYGGLQSYDFEDGDGFDYSE
jgi:hypothetical protein